MLAKWATGAVVDVVVLALILTQVVPCGWAAEVAVDPASGNNVPVKPVVYDADGNVKLDPEANNKEGGLPALADNPVLPNTDDFLLGDSPLSPAEADGSAAPVVQGENAGKNENEDAPKVVAPDDGKGDYSSLGKPGVPEDPVCKKVEKAMNEELDRDGNFKGKGLKFRATGKVEKYACDGGPCYYVSGEIVDKDGNVLVKESLADFILEQDKVILTGDPARRLKITRQEEDLKDQLGFWPNSPVKLDFALNSEPFICGIGGEAVSKHLYRFLAAKKGRITLWYKEITSGLFRITIGGGGSEPVPDQYKSITFQVGDIPSQKEDRVIYLNVGESYDLYLNFGGAGVEVPLQQYQWLTSEQIAAKKIADYFGVGVKDVQVTFVQDGRNQWFSAGLANGSRYVGFAEPKMDSGWKILNAVETDLGIQTVRNIADSLKNDGISFDKIMKIETGEPSSAGFGVTVTVQGGKVGNAAVNFIYTGILTGTAAKTDPNDAGRIVYFLPQPLQFEGFIIDGVRVPVRDLIEDALEAFKVRNRGEMSSAIFSKAVSIGFVRDSQETVQFVRGEILKLLGQYKIRENHAVFQKLDKLFREFVGVLDDYAAKKNLLIMVDGKIHEVMPEAFSKLLYELVRRDTIEDPEKAVDVEAIKQALRKSILATLMYRPDFESGKEALIAKMDEILAGVFSGLQNMDAYLALRRLSESPLGATYNLPSPFANYEIIARLFGAMTEILEGVPSTDTGAFFADDDRNNVPEMKLVEFERFLQGTLPAFRMIEEIANRVVSEKKAAMDSCNAAGQTELNEEVWAALRNLLKDGKEGIEPELKRILEKAKANIAAALLQVPGTFEYSLVNSANGIFQVLVNHFDHILRNFQVIVFSVNIGGVEQTVRMSVEYLSRYFTSQVDGQHGIASLPYVMELVERGLLDLSAFERENERAEDRRIELVSTPCRDNTLSTRQGYYDVLIAVAKLLISRSTDEERARLLGAVSGGMYELNTEVFKELALTNAAIKAKMAEITRTIEQAIREIHNMLEAANKPLSLSVIHAMENLTAEVRAKVIRGLEKFVANQHITHSLVLAEMERLANERFHALIGTVEQVEIDNYLFTVTIGNKDIVMTMKDLGAILKEELAKVGIIVNDYNGWRVAGLLKRLNITEEELKRYFQSEKDFEFGLTISIGGLDRAPEAYNDNAVLSFRCLRDMVAKLLIKRYLAEDQGLVTPNPDGSRTYVVALEVFRNRLTKGVVREGNLYSRVLEHGNAVLARSRALLESIRERMASRGATLEDFKAIDELLRNTRQEMVDSVLADLLAAGIGLNDLFGIERGEIEYALRGFQDFSCLSEYYIECNPVVKIVLAGQVVSVDWQRLRGMISSWVNLEKYVGIKEHQDVLSGKETWNVHNALSYFSLSPLPSPEGNGFSSRGLRDIVFALLEAFAADGKSVIGQDTNNDGVLEVSITGFAKALYGFDQILAGELGFTQSEIDNSVRAILALGIGTSGPVDVALLRKMYEILRKLNKSVTDHLTNGVRYMSEYDTQEFAQEIEREVNALFAKFIAAADQLIEGRPVVFTVNVNGRNIAIQMTFEELADIIREETEKKLGGEIEGKWDFLKLPAVTYSMLKDLQTLGSFLMGRQVHITETGNPTYIRVKQKLSAGWEGIGELVLGLIEAALQNGYGDILTGPGANGHYRIDKQAFRKFLNTEWLVVTLEKGVEQRTRDALTEIYAAAGVRNLEELKNLKKIPFSSLRNVWDAVSGAIEGLKRYLTENLVGCSKETFDNIMALANQGVNDLVAAKALCESVPVTFEFQTVHGKQEVAFTLQEVYDLFVRLIVEKEKGKITGNIEFLTGVLGKIRNGGSLSDDERSRIDQLCGEEFPKPVLIESLYDIGLMKTTCELPENPQIIESPIMRIAIPEGVVFEASVKTDPYLSMAEKLLVMLQGKLQELLERFAGGYKLSMEELRGFGIPVAMLRGLDTEETSGGKFSFHLDPGSLLAKIYEYEEIDSRIFNSNIDVITDPGYNPFGDAMVMAQSAAYRTMDSIAVQVDVNIGMPRRFYPYPVKETLYGNISLRGLGDLLEKLVATYRESSLESLLEKISAKDPSQLMKEFTDDAMKAIGKVTARNGAVSPEGLREILGILNSVKDYMADLEKNGMSGATGVQELLDFVYYRLGGKDEIKVGGVVVNISGLRSQANALPEDAETTAFLKDLGIVAAKIGEKNQGIDIDRDGLIVAPDVYSIQPIRSIDVMPSLVDYVSIGGEGISLQPAVKMELSNTDALSTVISNFELALKVCSLTQKVGASAIGNDSRVNLGQLFNGLRELSRPRLATVKGPRPADYLLRNALSQRNPLELSVRSSAGKSGFFWKNSGERREKNKSAKNRSKHEKNEKKNTVLKNTESEKLVKMLMLKECFAELTSGKVQRQDEAEDAMDYWGQAFTLAQASEKSDGQLRDDPEEAGLLAWIEGEEELVPGELA